MYIDMYVYIYIGGVDGGEHFKSEKGILAYLYYDINVHYSL